MIVKMSATNCRRRRRAPPILLGWTLVGGVKRKRTIVSRDDWKKSNKKTMFNFSFNSFT
jgi:hypothetical protein